MTVEDNIAHLVDQIVLFDGPTLLWFSLPCTGGCPYNAIHNNNLGGQDQIDSHAATFLLLSAAYKQVADAVLAQGGVIAHEWLAGGLLWPAKSPYFR